MGRIPLRVPSALLTCPWEPHMPETFLSYPVLDWKPGCSARKTKRIKALKVRELIALAEGGWQGALSTLSPDCSP